MLVCSRRSLLHFLPHCFVYFILPQELKLFINGACFVSEIEMPSNQYRFALDNQEIAALNHQDSSVTGRKLGTVKITLIDNSILYLNVTFHI